MLSVLLRKSFSECPPASSHDESGCTRFSATSKLANTERYYGTNISGSVCIDDCIFSELDAEGNGGAICVTGAAAKFSVENTFFVNCTSEATGGAVYSSIPSSYIENVCGLDCTAISSHFSYFGGDASSTREIISMTVQCNPIITRAGSYSVFMFSKGCLDETLSNFSYNDAKNTENFLELDEITHATVSFTTLANNTLLIDSCIIKASSDGNGLFMPSLCFVMNKKVSSDNPFIETLTNAKTVISCGFFIDNKGGPLFDGDIVLGDVYVKHDMNLAVGEVQGTYLEFKDGDLIISQNHGPWVDGGDCYFLAGYSPRTTSKLPTLLNPFAIMGICIGSVVVIIVISFIVISKLKYMRISSNDTESSTEESERTLPLNDLSS